MSEGKRAGILLRVDGALTFVPANVATTVTTLTRVTRVAGAPDELLGIALHEGAVVPVVAIGTRARDAAGSGRETMVVCTYLGEPIALVGGEIVSAGVSDVEDAETIDLAAIHARIRAGGWSTRWGA